MVMVTVMSIVIMSMYVIGGVIILKPNIYLMQDNKALKSALNINDISYSIDPLIVPRDGKPVVGLAFNMRY